MPGGYSTKRQFVPRKRVLRWFSGLGALDPSLVIGDSGLTVSELQATGYSDADIEAIIAGQATNNPGNVLPGSPLQQLTHIIASRGNSAAPTPGNNFSQWLAGSAVPGIKNSYLLAGGAGLFALAAIAGGRRR